MAKTRIQLFFAIMILYIYVNNQKNLMRWFSKKDKKTIFALTLALIATVWEIKCLWQKTNMQCFWVLIYLHVKNERNLKSRFWTKSERSIFMSILAHFHPSEREREFSSKIWFCHFFPFDVLKRCAKFLRKTKKQSLRKKL